MGDAFFTSFLFLFLLFLIGRVLKMNIFLKSQGGWRKMDIANALIKLTKGVFF